PRSASRSSLPGRAKFAPIWKSRSSSPRLWPRRSCRTMPSPRRSSKPEPAFDSAWASAADIAAAVRAKETSAREVVEDALARITARDPVLNSFTDVLADRARERAAQVDAARKKGPLAGVPFAVKNLFDVNGLPTRAGSKINRTLPPAQHDSPLIARL